MGQVGFLGEAGMGSLSNHQGTPVTPPPRYAEALAAARMPVEPANPPLKAGPIPSGWQPDLLGQTERLRALVNKVRYMPLRRADGVRGAVYEDTPSARSIIARLRQAHPKAADLLFLAPRGTVQAMWADALGADLTAFSQNHLAHTQPNMSARETLVRSQAIALVALAIGFALWAALAAPSLFMLLNGVFGALYFSVGMARILAVLTPMPRLVRYQPLANRTPDEALPMFSVLIPIYDEAAMVPQLIDSMVALDYPAAKLEILILAEADDSATLLALAKQDLPDHMAVIRVPPSKPRTKPKALNFALPLTRGAFITIYDAEDRPERDQLRKAVAMFEAAKGKRVPKLGCVQAALHVTNGRANFLTQHFALEYMALFDAFLPAFSRFNLPIPLGGTSNHFHRSALIEAGGWDPYNVTEDADLGIRLARLGYATHMIASTTFEEAPTGFKPWIKQRARWFKGWWQTWLVHMRHPLRLLHELGLGGFLAFQTIMLGVLVSVLIHPFFLLATLWALSGMGGPLYAAATGTGQVLIMVNLVNFSLGYVSVVLLSGAGANRRGMKQIVPVLLSIPLYWICLSAAGFLALWELIRRPHHWNKTPHEAV